MVMIGGNSRNAGKTTLACGIISKLAATHDIIGLKVTSIRPGEEGLHGAHDENYLSDFEVMEELDAGSQKDTSKMLRAGAKQVFYLRVYDFNAEKAIVLFLKNFANNVQGQHRMQAEVVGLVGQKIQLQMFIEDAQKSINGAKKMLISIDPSQLQRLPSEKGETLRVGQSLTLAITKIGSMDKSGW